MDKVYFNGVVGQALFTAHTGSIKLEFIHPMQPSLEPLKIKLEGTRFESSRHELIIKSYISLKIKTAVQPLK
jgi:hypothetical protein